MRRLLTRFVLILLCATIAAHCQSALDTCRQGYANTLTRFTNSDRQDVFIELIRRQTTSGSNFNISDHFDNETQALINGLPVIGKMLNDLNIHSDQSFNEAYSKGTLSYSNVSNALVEPVVDAMDRFNVCMKLATKGIALTVESADPGQVVIAGHFQDKQSKFGFTMLPGPFTCRASDLTTKRQVLVGNAVIIMDQDFSIMCSRPGQPKNGNIGYTQAAISIVGTGADPFVIKVPADELYGLQTRNKARAIFDERRRLDKQAKANIEQQKAITASLQNRVDRTTIVKWYYFSKDAGPADGRRYACDMWNGGEVAHNQVRQQMCPSGKLVGETSIGAFGGDCGVNKFIAACVPSQ